MFSLLPVFGFNSRSMTSALQQSGEEKFQKHRNAPIRKKKIWLCPRDLKENIQYSLNSNCMKERKKKQKLSSWSKQLDSQRPRSVTLEGFTSVIHSGHSAKSCVQLLAHTISIYKARANESTGGGGAGLMSGRTRMNLE